ncbi:uncharacterized protein LOC132701744 isoform X3 [Cylas formicarius]|uniref:uncharacterized protein LOC132701744 isoform X3 n=1 Tax=Cylas formicarius TaxID=197179 RepID=UPI0029589152|nr:uncharacterized protein LOC132701744 isoform X3 [Cylas formicarius]
MTAREVVLEGGSPWGFRMNGGVDLKTPLKISRVNPGSKASQRGVREGDLITSINGQSTKNLSNSESHALLKNSEDTLKLGLNEDVEGSPRKRQYRTIQQETHQQTVKRSNVTRTTIQEAEEYIPPTNKGNPSCLEGSRPTNGFDLFKENRQNGRVKHIPISSASTSSSSTSTPSTLVGEGKTVSSDNAVASRQSSYSNCSSFFDEGSNTFESDVEDMNDGAARVSKSKRRRQRRRLLRDVVEIKEIVPEKVEQLTKEEYKVESPKELKLDKRLKAKSKSLEDDDVPKIQELSEVGESEDKGGYDEAVIREASSEENLDPEKPGIVLNLRSEDCVESRSLISPEEEKELRTFLNGLNLINSPEESAQELTQKSDPKTRKHQNRKELEQYFLPICQNPRYLDAISEETSDVSDKEPSGASQHLKQGTPELDLPPVPPRRNKNKTFRQLEQPDAVLVETKLVDRDGFQESICNTKVVPQSDNEVEVVYINDSGESSTSSGDFTDVYNDCQPPPRPELPLEVCIDANNESLTNRLSTIEPREEDVCKTFYENSMFSQLTPPPTPDNVTPKNEKVCEAKSIFFDYTKIPNVLSEKEPPHATHLKNILTGRANVDTIKCEKYKKKITEEITKSNNETTEKKLVKEKEVTSNIQNKSEKITELNKSNSTQQELIEKNTKTDIIENGVSDDYLKDSVDKRKETEQHRTQTIQSVTNVAIEVDVETKGSERNKRSLTEGQAKNNIETTTEKILVKEETSIKSNKNVNCFSKNTEKLIVDKESKIIQHEGDSRERITENYSCNTKIEFKKSNLTPERKTDDYLNGSVDKRKETREGTTQTKQPGTNINFSDNVNVKTKEGEQNKINLIEEKAKNNIETNLVKEEAAQAGESDNYFTKNTTKLIVEKGSKTIQHEGDSSDRIIENYLCNSKIEFKKSNLTQEDISTKRKNRKSDIVESVDKRGENTTQAKQPVANINVFMGLEAVTKDSTDSVESYLTSKSQFFSKTIENHSINCNNVDGHQIDKLEFEGQTTNEATKKTTQFGKEEKIENKKQNVLFNHLKEADNIPTSSEKLTRKIEKLEDIKIVEHRYEYKRENFEKNEASTKVKERSEHKLNDEKLLGCKNNQLNTTAIGTASSDLNRSECKQAVKNTATLTDENITTSRTQSARPDLIINTIKSAECEERQKSGPPSTIASENKSDEQFQNRKSDGTMVHSSILSPTLSDSADSTDSKESSLCTAKYNPNSSIADVTSITKEEEDINSKDLYQPASLRCLVLDALIALPFGTDMLEELAEVSKSIDNLTCDIPFRGLTRPIPAFIDRNPVSVSMNQTTKFHNSVRETRNKLSDLTKRSTDEDVSPANRLLSIIREDEDADNYLYFEHNEECERLKAKNLTEWLAIARNKSKSMSNLDSTSIPINNLRSENSVSHKSAPRRCSLPQEIYVRQLQDIMEKERQIQRELEQLEEEKRKIQAELAPSRNKFEVDDFYVSKKGDFAERREKLRPTSMPVFPTEFFRQQMYEEYMDKFSEREERKQQKVIKISSSHDLSNDKDKGRSKEIIHPIEIEKEFMDKVKQKLGKPDTSDGNDAAPGCKVQVDEVPPVLVLDGDKVKGVEVLPKHLQQFVDDMTAQGESIWSPGQRQTQPDRKELHRSDSKDSQNEPISPIWTPKSTHSSPTVERKEFRPVNFQSPVLSRRHRTASESLETSNSTSSEPPWRPPEGSSDTAIHLSSTLDRRLPTSHSTPGFGSFSTSTRLPKAQNPTITLLQKAREGQLPRGAQYIEQDSTFNRRLPNDRPPIKYPGEVLYHIKNEYTSESDSERPKKMAELASRKFEGIGPTTRDGMPLVLRSEVKDKDQSKWYKRMYDTIHKQKPKRDEFVTVRYKQKRAQYPYTSGYLSEPEPGAYDSDFTEYKYATLDRRRPHQTYDYTTSTMPRNVPDKSYSSSDIIRNTQEKYQNQPGRIENYTPGRSSISDKEAKKWWDEVMDIFDGWLDANSSLPSYDVMFRTAMAVSHLEEQKRVPTKPRSFINQALKESGYESDSTLVFRRREDRGDQLSPKEQKEAYKIIQKGGDVPFQGLRKPAPERPKETDIVEFFPLSPTLTRIRIHKNIVPQKEIFCYPVTVQHNAPKTFASYKRLAPSSITIPKIATPPLERAPSPPKRKSSRNNTTLRLISTMRVKTDKSPACKRHETCFSPSDDRTKVNYLRDKITCKLSPASKKKISVVKKVAASPDLKSKITSTLTTSKDAKSSVRKIQSTTKVSNGSKTRTKSVGSSLNSLSKRSSAESLSSRTSTPVKTFGSEKKRFDFVLPNSKFKLAKCDSEELLSPTEVQKAVRNIPSSAYYKKSFVPLSSSNVLPIKVGITEKGKTILKSSTKRAVSLSPKTTRKTPSPSAGTSGKLKTSNPTSSKTAAKQIEKVSESAKKLVKKTDAKCLSKATGAEVAKQLDRSEIVKQKEAIESDHFFRHLFLRNVHPSASFVMPRSSWIAERTNQLIRRRNSVSEPSIGAMKIYLKHTKPVTDSKFISLDVIRSRSASPKSVTFSDTVAAKRSKSLPAKMVFSQTSRPVSPVVTRKPKSPNRNNLVTIKRSPSPQTKLFFSETSRPVSPMLGRSPSSRRIKQIKQLTDEKKSCELTLYTCPALNYSTTSLDSFRSDDYQIYMRELGGSRTSEKFKDLNHFYSEIEKVGRLEKTFSLKPRRRCEGEIIDYDRWMEVRMREKAENELRHLYNHLKQDEKDKGFLYLPKDVDRFKWRRELDGGLRIKEKSVENIKEEFERIKREDSERENARRRELAYSKDTYKPLWRGNSVLSLASILTERRSLSEGRIKSAKQHLADDEGILNNGFGSRIWSSLSTQQVSNLKRQLQEIYGEESIPKARDYIVEVPRVEREAYAPKLTVRRNSESAKPDLMSEDEKKLISHTLSKEVLEKIATKRRENKIALPLVVGKEILGAVAAKEAKIKPAAKRQEPPRALVKTDALRQPSASETESGSTDESTRTVIENKDIKQKVEYFEKAKELEAYVPTVYKPADEDRSSAEDQETASPVHSHSCQDLKEYFGQTDLVKFATIPLAATRKADQSYTKKPNLRSLDMSPIRTISEANSFDSLIRSRSVSPFSEEARALAKKGEVSRLKKQFEYLEDFFGERSLKRSRSENDLGMYGHVEDMRRKYEYPAHSGRGRSRTRRGGVVSPVYLRAEDRYMPHINIISKIATLYSRTKKNTKESTRNVEELAQILGCPVGEVEKMKEKFDRLKERQDDISLIGHMYTSSPSLKELRDITPYLTANWIAHKYPRSEDNTRSLSSPETSLASRDMSLVRRDRLRSSSTSPSKKGQSILKRREAGQRIDDKLKRFEPVRYSKEPDLPPPPPPPKGQGGVRSQELSESPRKYVENQVTIHYKTPVRQEIKEYVSEDELAYRQAEAMKKIYEEERKRKYLQELQDMKSRRHTDNFIPSQKSPIPLNRYDDFDDLTNAPKVRPRSPEPRLVARALYNFVGQTARELTFRKGDLIYVRRQVDKNWYEGELNAMVGLFPVNYVEIVPYDGAKSTPRKAHEGQARAKYNFVAQTHLELSLAKGELVTITRRVDDNWYEGKIGGRKGIFPVSYVEVLIDPSDPPPPSTKPVAAPAAHSLLLNGSAQGKESMGSHLYTPNISNSQTSASYHAKPVQLTGNGTYSTLPRASKGAMSQALHIETQSEPVAYRALYKYNPQNDDELELLEGDTVYVLEKCDDGWYVGSSVRTGAFGTFPGNYVEKI